MKLVLIEWIDSSSAPDGWNRLDELKISTKPIRCRSVGWLLHEGNDAKTLVAHISGESDQHNNARACGDMTIPNCAILKMRVLAKA